ncbi:MAG: hypothetical protein WC069_03565 [Candidatus Shapirobacteria bacterium]
MIFIGITAIISINLLFKNNINNLHTVIIVPGLGDKITASDFVSWLWQRQGIDTIIFDTKWKSDENYQNKLDRLLNLIDIHSEKNKRLSLVGTSAGGSLVLNAFNDRKEKIYKIITVCARLVKGELNGFNGYNQRTKGYPSFSESIIRSEESQNNLSNEDKQKIMTITANFGDELVPKNTSIINGANNIFIPTIEHSFSITSGLTIFSKKIIDFIKY